MANLFVVDVETTGLSHELDQVVELAMIKIQDGAAVAAASSFVNPGMSIPAAASGVHHIVDADVANAPPLEEVLFKMVDDLGLNIGEDFLVAHNAPYDAGFIPLDCEWLDTCASSRHVFPGSPSYKNQVLRYFLPLTPLEPPVEGVPENRRTLPHSAYADCCVTGALLLKLLEAKSLDELLVLQHQPVLLPVVGFGKHRGQTWDTVPKDYLRWLASKDDLRPDVRFTVEHHLAQ